MVEELLRKYGYNDRAIEKIVSTYLMQSVDLTCASYNYLTKGRKIEINLSNANQLFLGAKAFEKKYGITKEELLEKYNYKKDKRMKVLKYEN